MQKDIDLPVCKIGMTKRDPYTRCAEINNSSTGDFLWEVSKFFAVNDCAKLERVIHDELKPLKQKRREFFNISAEVADKAVISIINKQNDINFVDININGLVDSESPDSVKPKKKRKRTSNFQSIDSEYSELLLTFAGILGVKGLPFGQLNKPLFGVSDGNEGIQWNLAIYRDTGEIRLGVNLEGKVYSNWPIADFILSELKSSSLMGLTTLLSRPENIYLQFMRDAWQVASRPEIEEKYFGGNKFPFSKLDDDLWMAILKEALDCLDEKQGYRARNKQKVTYKKPPKKGDQIRLMPVSPHLSIYTPVSMEGDIEVNLRNGFKQLEPVYDWVSQLI
ncbi:MAG: GIY-YIG nuclease family protein [Deltaproteobacteria bacterium]|nr:GIY-YIG nuclease family protein [Deltaproteobacteria bacterium]